jgi:NADH-quinone oxidoreductase subunit C
MADEEKKPDLPVSAPQGRDSEQAATEKPAVGAMPPTAKPGAPGGGTPAAKPPAAAAPKPPAGPAPQPWDDDFSRRARQQLGEAVKESLVYLGQNYFIVDAARIREVSEYMKTEEDFDYLVDLTAVDYPKRDKRFEIIYQLYSFPRNVRLRLKAPLAETETIESVVPVWSTANWLEREVYDMFGVRFEGHPDLKRILLPEGWQGHPLRKDHSILQQDTQWVQENLHIESGQ